MARWQYAVLGGSGISKRDYKEEIQKKIEKEKPEKKVTFFFGGRKIAKEFLDKNQLYTLIPLLTTG